MKKFLPWAFVCLSVMAHATVTITASLKDMTGTAVTTGMTARLTLKGCSTNLPRVIGTGIVPAVDQDFTPDSVTGVVTMTVYKNADITCGTTTGGTSYDFSILRFGTVVKRANYIFSVSADISSMSPTTSQPVVPAPTGDSTYLRLDGGNLPFLGRIDSCGGNGFYIVGSSCYTTMLDCYAALSSGGGVCGVMPGHTETLTSDLTLNKANTGFVFFGPATITMGSHRVVVTPGTSGIFIYGVVPSGSVQTTARFNYSGSSDAFLVGDSSTDTRQLSIANIGIVAQTAGANGINLKRVQYGDARNVSIDGNSSGSDIVLDGTGNYSGSITFVNLRLGGAGNGVLLTGSGNQAGNANKFDNTHILGGTVIGFNFQASSQGNTVDGGDIEGTTTAVNFGGTSVNNEVRIRTESVTNDALFSVGSQFNSFTPLQSVTSITDAGTMNTVRNRQYLKFDAAGNITASGGNANIAGFNGIALSGPATYGWDVLYTRQKLVGGSTAILGFSSGLPNASPDATVSRQASGITQFGDGGQNANGTAAASGFIPGGGDAITWFKKATHSSLDLVSVATGACTAETTEAITGALLGDRCSVDASTALEAGGFFVCKVTATDTAKWQLCNLSGGAIDRASDTYTVRDIR